MENTDNGLSGLVYREQIDGTDNIRHLANWLGALLDTKPAVKRMVCKVFWEDDFNPEEAQ
jgi:hypothetical protein